MPRAIVILLSCVVALLAAILIVILVKTSEPEPTPQQAAVEKLAEVLTSEMQLSADEAKIKATEAQLSVFGQAIDIYQLDIGTYPTTQQGLAALRVAPPDLADKSKWQGPYHQREIPLDPWSKPYYYELPTPDRGWRVYSGGPDGEPNTADDVSLVKIKGQPLPRSRSVNHGAGARSR